MTDKEINALNKKHTSGEQSYASGDLGIHPHYHYKFCPRCAAKGEFCDHNMSFKCNSCGFHFFMNSAAAVTALIFNSLGQLLVVKRALEPGKGKPDLPGGFIDPSENAETALLRELKEELNLIPDSIEYYGSFPNQYIYSEVTVYTTDFVFRCMVSDFSNIRSDDDIAAFSFINPSDINLEEIPFESVKNILISIINEGRSS